MQRFYTPTSECLLCSHTQQTVFFNLGVCAVEWYCYCALCSQAVGKRLSNHMVVALSAVISCFLMTFDLDKSQLIIMSIHTKMGGCVYICINTLIAVYVSLTKVAEVTLIISSPPHKYNKICFLQNIFIAVMKLFNYSVILCIGLFLFRVKVGWNLSRRK